jgi:hypothetical protein
MRIISRTTPPECLECHRTDVALTAFYPDELGRWYFVCDRYECNRNVVFGGDPESQHQEYGDDWFGD